MDHVCIDEGFLYMLNGEITREDVMKVIKTDHAMVMITYEIKNTAKNKQVKKKTKNGREKGHVIESNTQRNMAQLQTRM